MDTSSDAPHRRVSVEVAEVTLQLAWWGTIVTVLLAWTLSRIFPPAALRVAGQRFMERLLKPSQAFYALALAALSGGLALITARVLYQGFFTNVDEIASTLHARYLAEGLMAGPTLGAAEAWLIPNTLIVPEGIVSQFPPMHLVLMAGLTRLGAPMMAGPLMIAVLSGMTALSLLRLLPDRAGAARVAALVVAVSPFLIFLGGGSMSHVSAGAFGAAVLYAALRARDGSAWWAVGTGAAVGLMVSDRPLVGLVLGSVFTLGVWVPAARPGAKGGEGRGLPWLARRAGGTILGGLPFAGFLAWYNARLFGSPMKLGYLAAFGDHHRLGFHMDPWGYEYTLREAAAFTSTDILSLGIQLMETPFPFTAFLGLYLLLGMRLPRGAGLLLAWALLPVISNGYYWFHDVRMLFEAAPAWIALGVLGAIEMAGAGREGERDRVPAWGRDMAAWIVVIGIVGSVAWGVPTRWGSYGWSQETLDRIAPPAIPGERAAIVFVHSSWNERLSATLQGAGGMRQDSVITALRRNTNCALHLYALGREALASGAGDVTLPDVDLKQAPGTPPDIERPPAPTGASLRIRQREPFPASCARELRADRFGAVALAPLVWQGDLPGIEEGRPLFVRDLGPEKNQRLLDRYPERAAFVFVPKAADQAPEVVPYAEAMTALWGAPPSAAADVP